VRSDAGRLARENAALHEQLLRDAERHDAAARASYAATKRLEDRVAELSYWRTQALARYDGLERDNAALRRRVAELIRAGERRTRSGERAVAALMLLRHRAVHHITLITHVDSVVIEASSQTYVLGQVLRSQWMRSCGCQ
jgi:hypothetical protein